MPTGDLLDFYNSIQDTEIDLVEDIADEHQFFKEDDQAAYSVFPSPTSSRSKESSLRKRPTRIPSSSSNYKSANSSRNRYQSEFESIKEEGGSSSEKPKKLTVRFEELTQEKILPRNQKIEEVEEISESSLEDLRKSKSSKSNLTKLSEEMTLGFLMSKSKPKN